MRLPLSKSMQKQPAPMRKTFSLKLKILPQTSSRPWRTSVTIVRYLLMLDPSFVRENRELVEKKLGSRGIVVDLTDFFSLDETRRSTLRQVEDLKHKSNVVSKQIGEAKGRGEEMEARKEEMRQVKEQIRQLDDVVRNAETRMTDYLLNIPNLPHDSVPAGASAADNAEVRQVEGTAPKVDFTAQTHIDLGTKLGILDFARAAKITGSRFVLYRGTGALLERALINFMLDVHTSKGYVEILPPFIVNADSLRGTGNLPKFEEDLFRLQGTNYYLIP